MRATTMHLALVAMATMAHPVGPVELAPLPKSAGQPPAWNIEPGRNGIEPGKLDEWARRRRRRTKGRRARR